MDGPSLHPFNPFRSIRVSLPAVVDPSGFRMAKAVLMSLSKDISSPTIVRDLQAQLDEQLAYHEQYLYLINLYSLGAIEQYKVVLLQKS